MYLDDTQSFAVNMQIFFSLLQLFYTWVTIILRQNKDRSNTITRKSNTTTLFSSHLIIIFHIRILYTHSRHLVSK